MGFPILVRCHLYIESGPRLRRVILLESQILKTCLSWEQYWFIQYIHDHVHNGNGVEFAAASLMSLGFFWQPLTQYIWTFWVLTTVNVLYICVFSCILWEIKLLLLLLPQPQPPPPSFTLIVYFLPFLTHWGRATHICIGKLTIIGSDNGLSPGRCQAIIWTIAGKLLIGPLGTNFSEILIGIQTFSF